MKSLALRYSFLLVLFSSICSYGQTDTATINKWNDRALDLAYSDPAEGFKVATKSLREARAAHFSRGEVRALIRLGIIYDVQSNDAKAIEMYKLSLALAEKTKDKKGIASNLNNLGLIYYKTNDFSNALKFFNEGYAIFSELKDDQNLGNISNNIGLIHNELGTFNKGLYWFRKAIGHYRRANDTYTINDVYSNIGNTYDSQKQYDSARIYINKAIAGYRRTDNKYGLTITLNNLGLVVGRGNAEAASIPYFEEAMVYSRELKNNYGLVSSGFNLSAAYKASNRFADQLRVLEEIYPLLGKIDSDELGYKVCYDLALSYFRKGDFAEGKLLMDQYRNFHKSYYDQIVNKNIQETEQRFAVKEQRQRSEFRFRQQENARFRDNLLWTAGLAGLILIGLLAFFIIRKGNLQKELENQKAVFDATMEERKRISYDLHDHVGSQLSYVVNNLELIRHTDQENDRINRTFNMSQAAMSSLRDTVWALHTEELTVESLSQRMENVARKTTENSEAIQLKFDLRADGEAVLPPQVTMHIMRIFQEAVHNVVKHAHASWLEVIITEQAADFLVKISDNGIGMENAAKPFHYGLQSMQDRALKIGGKLTIESAPQKGTTITLYWPKQL